MYSEIYDGPARAIAHATANTLEGCIIQARLLVREYLEEGNWADDCDKHLANSLLAGLERLAGGGS